MNQGAPGSLLSAVLFNILVGGLNEKIEGIFNKSVDLGMH